jgi:hypothetical protein
MQAEVTRPDHYSIWLSTFDILQAARGRTAFLDVHGDTGALYRLGFFSPQGTRCMPALRHHCSV